MKIEVLQANLAEKLSLIQRISSSRSTLPILSNTLIESDAGRLKLSSTNLEVSLEVWVGGNVIEEGRTTISTSLFFNYVQNLSPEKLLVRLDETNVHIEGTSSKAQFLTMPSDDFPSFPTKSADQLWTVSPLKLNALLKKVLFASASNESRPVLTGILFRGTPDGLIVVATDGFRLAEITVDWESLDVPPPMTSFELIIPSKMLKEIGQFASHLEDDETWGVFLTEDKNQIVFSTQDIKLYARLLEAQFPQYENIIPSDFVSTVHFDIQALIQAVKTASLFAHSQSHTVRFAVDAETNQIIVAGESTELGSQESTLSCEMTGDSFQTAFNAHYVLDALQSFDGDRATLHIQSSEAPALFIPSSASSLGKIRQVVMPVRVDSQ